MKNHVSFLLLFLTVITNVCSQKNVIDERVNTSSYITLSPLSLLDFHAPRLRMGFTQHVAEHLKIGFDLGIGGGTGLLSKRESEDDILWEVRPEIYYILKPESRTTKYLSTEFFYIAQSNTLLNNVYDREDDMRIRYDRADFERQKYGVHFKFGLFLNTGRHWGFNFYGGIGFRWATIAFSNLVNAEEDTTRHQGHGYETIYDAERSNFRPNPSLGAKIYYKL